VLGVAGLVAILTHVSHADPIAGYRHGLILITAFFAAAGVIAAALLTRRPSAQAAPAALVTSAVHPAVVPPAAPLPGSGERAGQPGLHALGSDATTRS